MGDPRVYTVRHTGGFTPQADWTAPHWCEAETGSIDSFPWSTESVRPQTEFRLLYSRTALHVMFQVRERSVRSVTTRYGGPVWTDSCVELFFAPSTLVGAGYFNVEVNCGGTALVGFQRGRGDGASLVDGREVRRLAIAHSLPSIVEPEMIEPVTWTLEYVLPFDLLAGKTSLMRPAPGVEWRGNLYKCAESNSQPHWGSWSPIEAPSPDFHRPEFFGVLEFE